MLLYKPAKQVRVVNENGNGKEKRNFAAFYKVNIKTFIQQISE
jgi:hypothetical protein